MTDEERVERILWRILEAIEPDQGDDGFVHIFNALTQALSFQMALLCPDCRRKLAQKLRAQIPAMLTSAREAQQKYGEHHLH